MDTIAFECMCGKSLKVDKRLVGKMARCPACGVTVRIPGSNGVGRPPEPARATPTPQVPSAPQEVMPVEWYYYISAQKLGPVPPETIVAMIRTGALNSATQIWREGLTEWVPLGATPDFAACCTVTAPTPTVHPSVINDIFSKNSDFLIPAGYICAVISILFLPPVFGLAGMAIGTINLTKGRVSTGIIQIVLSIICACTGMFLGMEMMSSR